MQTSGLACCLARSYTHTMSLKISPRAKIFADAVTPQAGDMPLDYLMQQFNEQRISISLQAPSTPQHGIERIVELKIRRWMKDNEEPPPKKP